MHLKSLRFIIYLIIIFFVLLDPDTANGNTIESSKTEDTIKDDINQNEKSVKSPNNNIKLPTITNDDTNEQVTDVCENGNKTDKVVIVEQEITLPDDADVETKQMPLDKSETQETTPVKFVPKYKYGDGKLIYVNFYFFPEKLSVFSVPLTTDVYAKFLINT